MRQTTTLRIRLALTGIALALSAYLAIGSVGGFLVFGFSNFEEFAVFAAPVFSFPIAVAAFWKPRTAAAVFALLFASCLFVHAKLAWPDLHDIVFGPWQFFRFLAPTVVLIVAALFTTQLAPVKDRQG